MNKEARKKELIEKINKRAVYNMHFVPGYSDKEFIKACDEYLNLIEGENMIDKTVVTDIVSTLLSIEREFPSLSENEETLESYDFLLGCLIDWHDVLFNPSKDLLDYIPGDDE